MRMAVSIADTASWIPLAWFALGTLISQLFPTFTTKVLQEYKAGRYNRKVR